MKKLILAAISVILLIPSLAFSAPFLMSDPVDPLTCGAVNQPTCPTTASIFQETMTSLNPITWGPPAEIATNVPVESDMSLKYDLGSIATGVHRFKAIYHDAVGGVSVQSNPTVLGPASPQGLKLTP